MAVLKQEERKEACEEGWWGERVGKGYFTALSAASAK
jgi:hypothetical protein